MYPTQRSSFTGREVGLGRSTRIAQAGRLALPREIAEELDRLSRELPAFAPVEAMVDWLEAAYGGPITAVPAVAR